MSRVGRKPVVIPKGVDIQIQGGRVSVKGPKGTLTFILPPKITASVKEGKCVVAPKDETREAKAQFGLARNLIQNRVTGVTEGFKKELEIQGVGYRADVKGRMLNLLLGFSHPVDFPIPEGITIKVNKQVEVTIEGADKEKVGQVAADIRVMKLPEPYQGKGIRYKGEVIRRKVGKAAAGAAGG